jgi:hypothetical protein
MNRYEQFRDRLAEPPAEEERGAQKRERVPDAGARPMPRRPISRTQLPDKGFPSKPYKVPVSSENFERARADRDRSKGAALPSPRSGCRGQFSHQI